MTLGHPLPSWAIMAGALILLLAAWRAYAGTLVSLSAWQRAVLVGVRAAVLLAAGFFMLRPLMPGPPDTHSLVVPVLVDVSRSMSIEDANGKRRIEEAAELVTGTIVPRLGRAYTVEVLRFADSVEPAGADGLKATTGRGTDLVGALDAVRERYRGRPLGGIVVVSDGGDNGSRDSANQPQHASAPLVGIGVGSEEVADRAITSVSVNDVSMPDAAVDLAVEIASRGLDDAPFEARLARNGTLVDTRTVSPSPGGSPVRLVFSIAPDSSSPSLYRVSIPTAAGEATASNNEASVVVNPPVGRRLVLFVQGMPGFEHAFLQRALARDAGLEVDSVVRKGADDGQGGASFLVRAASGQAVALSSGFPKTREALFAYDAVIVANAGRDYFSRDQLRNLADFVGSRGGGLLVVGAAGSAAVRGTPLEDVLPTELPAAPGAPMDRAAGRVALTPEGRDHAITRLAPTTQENEKRWRELPALAAVSLGRPRPGAEVLVEEQLKGRAARPLVAVQRYGAGRAMVFAGEAAWRWKMARPAGDRSYEWFWRQAARWLSEAAPRTVQLSAGPSGHPDAIDLAVNVSDPSFEPASDATVIAEVTSPSGELRVVTVPAAAGEDGLYAVRVPADSPGVYEVEVTASRGGEPYGTAKRAVLVGGTDLEMRDVRADFDALDRLARRSGGTRLDPRQADSVARALRRSASVATAVSPADWWHSPWSMVLLIGLLYGEWVLRRNWGLK
ncbi:MAG: glutamine amidotransferase [Vicinamibacterales bacterium]